MNDVFVYDQYFQKKKECDNVISWVWLIPAIFVSGALGLIMAALCAAAGRDDV